ncbi:MAG: cell division protein FtsZ [Muribaculaceae bacterium]|nr:cell division protein FtsZ [Muribaculaceae bacterium]
MSDNFNISDASAFAEDEFRIPPIIKVIGVGGGGGNAVDYLYSQGIENVTFMVCNTDKQAIRKLKVPNKILLGDEGLGAGDNPAIGRDAAEKTAEQIRATLNDDTKMVFITAGMGGGTGTGAGPVVAKIAKDAGMLTIGIVTIPFFFEGNRKIIKALEGAEEMRKHVDSLLIINNERLTEIYKDLTLINAFSKADDTLANATRSIAQIINTDGYINADFNDVKTTLENSSTAVISTGYGEGEHRVTKAIQDALNSPLLRNSDISSSKRLLFYLYCNPNASNVVTMAEMDEITQFSANLNPTIGIKWGACWDDSLGESVKITILASGFDISITPAGNSEKGPGHIIFEGQKKQPEKTPDPALSPEDARVLIASEYGGSKMKDHNRDMARKKYVVLKPSQFDSDEFIVGFEKSPAYHREIHQTEALRALGLPIERKSPDAQPRKTDGDTPRPESGSTTIHF